ncbi:hypothetical protein CC80DRAFT_324951 [Byssothecium circinans]|uniref:Uncharacterized protein n=1 Tax=Byssothecium circinans TaxID=147558 RepID=A0A6A5U3P7_9PLEO|nr:hypothetical protein CC80DRAFT_324951 [Byssothecium circinans]
MVVHNSTVRRIERNTYPRETGPVSKSDCGKAVRKSLKLIQNGSLGILTGMQVGVRPKIVCGRYESAISDLHLLVNVYPAISKYALSLPKCSPDPFATFLEEIVDAFFSEYLSFSTNEAAVLIRFWRMQERGVIMAHARSVRKLRFWEHWKRQLYTLVSSPHGILYARSQIGRSCNCAV